ncbi:MAG: cytochrome c [Nitrospirae bacterium]|nr:cytochrome c [Nitrospirota bacterium]MBI3353137.1 cytochrome c [Nitrospirota bacterium]
MLNAICLMIIGLGGILFSCTQNESRQEIVLKVQTAAPAELIQGETLYQNHCAGCHGDKASGTDKGPAFLSPIYEPNHHGDESFVLAARNGVRAHHWPFGDMPPVPNAKEEEVRQIIGYVRWLQREAHLY